VPDRFYAFTASPSSTVVESLDAIAGAVSLVAGTNITITDNSPSAGDITIAASGGGGGGIPSGGAAGQVVGYGGSPGTGAWVYPPGYQFDYVPITSNVTVSGTSGAQQTAITGNSVTYDGTTRVKVEFYAPVIEPAAATNAFVAVELWDGSTDLCELVGSNVPANGTLDLPASGYVFITPSAGTHQYIIKTYRQTSGSNGLIAAGTGTGGSFAPAFLRVTKA